MCQILAVLGFDRSRSQIFAVRKASCKSAFQSARSIRADELATYQKDESPRLGVQGAMWGREAKMSFGILVSRLTLWCRVAVVANAGKYTQLGHG